MAAVHAAKRELRAAMRQKIAAIPEASIYQQSSIAADALCSMPEYKAASRISIYLSMPRGEMVTKSLVENALAQGKQVFVPFIQISEKMNGPAKFMNMADLGSQADYSDCMHNRDAWGIPTLTSRKLCEREKVLNDDNSLNANLDMIIMPGVAFDSKLARLGHGKGFYDHFIRKYHDSSAPCHGELNKAHSVPLLIGLALEEQILADCQQVPTDDSDWRLDALVSGKGCILGGLDTKIEPPLREF